MSEQRAREVIDALRMTKREKAALLRRWKAGDAHARFTVDALARFGR